MTPKSVCYLFPLAAIAALSGCASREKPVARADISMPTSFVFAPPIEDSNPVDAASLLPVEDPAFKALIKRAATAPDLGIALARIEAARAMARRAGAERLPRVDASGNAGVQRSNPDKFGSMPSSTSVDSTRFTIGSDLTANWDFDLFGRLRASERAARYRLDAAGFDATAVRIALVSEIASAVADWQSVAAQRRQVEANIAAAQERARLIGSRVRAGLNPQLDSMRAEAVIAAQRSALAPLEGQAALIAARLVALTATPGETIIAELDLTEPVWDAKKPPSSVPSTLIATRPDVQAAAARLAASDAELAATAAQRFPRFTLSSALGLLAFSISGLFDSDAITGQLGASVAAPLLDFGRIEAENDQGKAQTKMAFEQLRNVSFTALGAAEEAFAALESLDREARLLEAQAMRENDAAIVAASRNRAGLENLIIVLDTDRIAYQAQQQAIAANGRAQRARIALWQALGGPGMHRFFQAPE